MTLLLAILVPWAANAQQALPYSYGFEDNDLSIDGWTTDNVSYSSTGIYNAGSGVAHEGTYLFRFNYNEDDALLISPKLTGTTNGVNVKFYYKNYDSSYTEKFQVGYTTSDTPTGFTYGDEISGTNDWSLYDNDFPANTTYVAILYIYTDAYYLYIDDFTFTAGNPYPAPKNLTADILSSTSALIGWTVPAVTPTNYVYQYKETASSTWSTEVTTTETSASITGLTAGTDYDFRVKATYSGNSSEYATTTFTTLTPVAISYDYGFEDAGGATPDIDNYWTVRAVDPYTMAWSNTDFNSEMSTSETWPRTGDYFFVFSSYDTDNTPSQYLISPELSGITAGLHVEFYYRQTTSGEEHFKVGYSTTDNAAASFTWSTEYDATAEYQRFSANYPAETKFVAVQYTSDYQYFLLLDDFLFEESASCIEPENVVYANVTTNSADISWTPVGSETAWDIYVTNSATEPNVLTTPTYANVATNTDYPITGLTGATTYYVYVRARCSSTEHSAWSVPAIFNTKCEGMALPYTYGFEDDALPICWNIINTNTSYNSAGIVAGNPHNGTHSLNFYRGSTEGILIAVLPEVDAAYPLNGYEISFWAKGSSDAPIVIGAMTDPTDANTFVAVGDPISPTSTYTQYSVRFNEYSGSGHYFAIRNNRTGGYYGQSTYVDDIDITALPSCLTPEDLAVSEITNHTAKLDWTGFSANYNVNYWTAAYTEGETEQFPSSSAPTGWERKAGLLSEVMGGTALTSGSDWSFGTANGVFDNHAKINIYGTSKKGWLITPSIIVASGNVIGFDLALTAYSGTLVAPATNGTDDRFVVLITTDDMATWTILREWNNSGSTYVYNDITCSATGENVSIDLSSYVGQTVRIAFYGESTVSNADNELHIDNVCVGTAIPAGTVQTATASTNTITLTGLLAERKYEVKVQGNCGSNGLSEWTDVIPFTTDIACAVPTGLAKSNVKSTSVDLSWTSDASAWVVAYKAASDTDFTEVDANENPYTLSGLDPDTDYTVKVKANCGGGDGVSEYSSTITFTTLEACAQPTDVAISNIGHSTATVTWTGDSPSFTVRYNVPAYVDGVDEHFNTSSIPTDWENKSGLLSTVMGGTALTSGSQWSFGTSNGNGVFDSHARINIYGSGSSERHGWLITPSLTLASGSTFTFDLALTAYSGTLGAPETTGTDDRFVVLITTDNMATWTILREWNNSGSTYVYNDITCSATGENVSIDLSSYVGQTVRIAFYGESTVSNADNNLHIDNVAIGVAVPASTPQTVTATTTTADLTGLTAGTTYEVVVIPSCNSTLESTPVNFTTIADNVKIFITEGDWNTASNWDGGIPTITDNAILRANATITTGVATAKKITKEGSTTPTLTINGGQLQTDNSVSAIVKKTIEGYGTGTGKYVLIANPLSSGLSSSDMTTAGLLSGSFDFYSWDVTKAEEWRNYEAGGFSYMYNGTGYLYANADDTPLTFTGTVKANNEDVENNLTFATSGTIPEFNGWNLYGNPFVCNAYLTLIKGTEDPAMAYYRMNTAGTGFEASTAPIAPMEGVFVQATASGQKVKFSRNSAKSSPNLNIVMNQAVTNRDAQGDTDNAIIRFDEGNSLEKFMLNANQSKVYIPQDGKDYAVVNAWNEGEMPLNFKAENNGSFTLSFSNENIEFSYLHLIDNFTGTDVDLLATPSYSFEARNTDNAARFTLKFNTGNANNDETFAYFNGSEWVIANGSNATLQVVDMMGRIVLSGTAMNTLSTNGMAPGVYVLRLVNGSNVRTQKIVVR